MNKLKLLTILLLLTATAFGQVSNEFDEKKPYIEVIGIAEKEIIPDEIYIAITIRERLEGREKISIEKQERDLKSALTSLGISLDNLSLSDANANYIRVNWTKKDVIAKSEYLLKVETANLLGKVFEKLDELKILDANISKVSHSKILEFKKEVRIMAIKSAKEKADYLLEAIGEQRGKPLKVYEDRPNAIQDDAYLNVRGARAKSIFLDGLKLSDSDNTIIQFEKIKLKSSIYVKFEIK